MKARNFLFAVMIFATLFNSTVLAHGGHHRVSAQNRNTVQKQAAPFVTQNTVLSEYNFCTISDCTLNGRHFHNGVCYYANENVQAENWGVCEYPDCTTNGSHHHNGYFYNSNATTISSLADTTTQFGYCQYTNCDYLGTGAHMHGGCFYNSSGDFVKPFNTNSNGFHHCR